MSKEDLFKDFDFETLNHNQFLDIKESVSGEADKDFEKLEIIDENEEEEDEHKDSKKKEDNNLIDIEDEEIENSGAPIHNVDSSLLLPLASALHEKGLLSSFNEEEFNKKVKEEYDGDAVEAFLDFVDIEIENRANFINSALNQEQRAYLEALATGIPTDFYASQKANQVKYETISEDELENSEELQKNVVKDYLKATTKFSDSKIDKVITDKLDTGALLEEAKEAVVELKSISKDAIEKAKKEQERSTKEFEEQNRRQLESIKEDISKTVDILGIKINKKLQDTIYQSMTVPVKKTPDGVYLNALAAKRAENPLEFEKKLHFLFHITKGFEDFEPLKKPVKSSAVQELKEVLDSRRQTTFKSGKTSSSRKHDTNFEEAGYINELSKLISKIK
jgi:hypothetical protein